MQFDSHGVSGGCWTGILRADTPPLPPQVIHRGQAVAAAAMRPAGPGQWAVSADLPPAVIEDGVHSLLLVAQGEGAGTQVLASLTLIAGEAAKDELLAEVAQLRAELDLLKREFRRFAAEG